MTLNCAGWILQTTGLHRLRLYIMELIEKLNLVAARAKNPWFKEYWQRVADELKANRLNGIT